jgi:hypothetical protein
MPPCRRETRAAPGRLTLSRSVRVEQQVADDFEAPALRRERFHV